MEGIDSKFYFENKLQYAKLQDELLRIVSFVTLQQVYNNEEFHLAQRSNPSNIELSGDDDLYEHKICF